MSRPRFTFRPDLRNTDHMAAWELLQAVPEGRRSRFLVRAILQTQEKTVLEETLRRVLREELRETPVRSQPDNGSQQPEDTSPNPPIPPEMMGFLDALLREK